MAKSIRNALQAMEDLNNGFFLLPAHIADAAHARHRQAKQDEALVPPRPSRRKRRLTLPLPEEVPKPKFPLLGKKPTVKQTTLDQPNSRLLRLPAELRALIWKEVICGSDKARIAISCRVSADVEGQWHVPERPVASQEHISLSGAETQIWGLGVVGLLCSCRVVYSEVIPLLYSTPTFYFSFDDWSGPLLFFGFVGMLVPQRREQVRWVEVEAGNGDLLRKGLNYRGLERWGMRSGLPDGRRGKGVDVGWAMGEVLKGMGGLEKGWDEILR